MNVRQGDCQGLKAARRQTGQAQPQPSRVQ